MLRALAAAKTHRRRSRSIAALAARFRSLGARRGRRAPRRPGSTRESRQAEHAGDDESVAPAAASRQSTWRAAARAPSRGSRPAWLTALPSAALRRAADTGGWPCRRPECRPLPPCPSTARHATSPPSPRVKPVAMPAQDHKPDRQADGAVQPDAIDQHAGERRADRVGDGEGATRSSRTAALERWNSSRSDGRESGQSVMRSR